MTLRTTVLLILIMTTGAISAAETTQRWLVKSLLHSQGNPVVLKAARRDVLRIQRSQLRIIDEVMDDILGAAELQANLYLIQGAPPNAHAGTVKDENIVMINFAMLGMIGKDRDQWSALLGHEVAHIKLEHTTSTRNRAIPLKLIDLAVQATATNPMAPIASSLLTSMINATFSREQERASDYLGAVWTVQVGHDAMGAAELHKKLAELGGEHPIAFMSSHPSGEERIKSLTELATRLQTSGPRQRPAPTRNAVEAQYLADANEGHTEAQFRLGEAYTLGQGVEQDYVKAFLWITLAADSGHRKARRFKPIVNAKANAVQRREAEALVKAWKEEHL